MIFSVKTFFSRHLSIASILYAFVVLGRCSYSFIVTPSAITLENYSFTYQNVGTCFKSIPLQSNLQEGPPFLLVNSNERFLRNRISIPLYNSLKDNEDKINGVNLNQKDGNVDEESKDDKHPGKDIDQLKKALENAKSNLDTCTSPGAGIEDPWEAAETAYADLIYTSTSFQNKTLSEEELMDLSKGGTMWEEGSTRQSTKGKGILKEISSLFGSLAGGAHIVRQDDGRI